MFMLVLGSGNMIVLFIFHACQQDADSLRSSEDDAVTERSLSQVAAQEGDAIRAANTAHYHSRRGRCSENASDSLMALRDYFSQSTHCSKAPADMKTYTHTHIPNNLSCMLPEPVEEPRTEKR